MVVWCGGNEEIINLKILKDYEEDVVINYTRGMRYDKYGAGCCEGYH
jgi:hypothetical protein